MLRSLTIATVAVATLVSTGCGQAPDDDLDGSESFVASVNGTVYYWAGCDNWRSIPPRNVRRFSTAEAAEAAGYRPSTARGCMPPRPIVDGMLSCTVERIIDGDTLTCAEGGERIRLLLIDAPEQTQGPFAEAATRELERLLPPGSVATLEIDVQERDRFGRILAYVYDSHGRMANELMLRAGLAVVLVYPPNVRYEARLRAVAEEARAREIGLWSGTAFQCAPVDHRAGRC